MKKCMRLFWCFLGILVLGMDITLWAINGIRPMHLIGHQAHALNIFNGNYNPNYNGLFYTEIAANDPDLLQVNGNAHLNGILQVAIADDYQPPLGATYTILNASSLSGRFNYLLTNLSPTVLFEPIYSANSVQVRVVRDYLNSQLSPSLSPNEIAVGGMLNRVAPTASGDLNLILTQIDALPSNAQVAKAYDQISPRTSTVQTTLALTEATLQSKNLIRRMQLLRQGCNKIDIGCVALVAEDGSLAENESTALVSCCPLNDRWGCFITGKVLLGNHKQTHLQDAYHTTTTGLTVGTDYEYFDNLFTGLMLGYNHSHIQLKQQAGEVNVNELVAGLYGTGRIQKLWFDTLFTYSWNNYQNKRNIHFGSIHRHAKAHPQGHFLSAYLDVGRDICFYDWILQPMASLQYTVVHIDEYHEKNAEALNLHVDSQFVRSAQGSLGATLNRRFEVCAMQLMSSLRGFYVYEFFTKSPRVRARLNTPVNSTFDIHSGASDKEFAVVGLGFSLLIQPKLMGYIDYDAEVARKDYFAQCLSAGLRGEF